MAYFHRKKWILLSFACLTTIIGALEISENEICMAV